MRTEQYFPQLSDREDREKWTDSGEVDAEQRATERAKAILAMEQVPRLPSEVRERIKREIKGIRDFVMD